LVIAEWAAFDAASAAFFLSELFRRNQVTGFGTLRYGVLCQEDRMWVARWGGLRGRV
jgi:hypothetical protein